MSATQQQQQQRPLSQQRQQYHDLGSKAPPKKFGRSRPIKSMIDPSGLESVFVVPRALPTPHPPISQPLSPHAQPQHTVQQRSASPTQTTEESAKGAAERAASPARNIPTIQKPTPPAASPEPNYPDASLAPAQFPLSPPLSASVTDERSSHQIIAPACPARPYYGSNSAPTGPMELDAPVDIDGYCAAWVFPYSSGIRPPWLRQHCGLLCWWCAHTFDNVPFVFPISINDTSGVYKITGVFCGPSCAIAYGKSHPDITRNLSPLLSIKEIAIRYYGYDPKDPRLVTAAPPRELLSDFWPDGMTIDQFRAKTACGRSLVLEPPFLTAERIVTEQYADWRVRENKIAETHARDLHEAQRAAIAAGAVPSVSDQLHRQSLNVEFRTTLMAGIRAEYVDKHPAARVNCSTRTTVRDGVKVRPAIDAASLRRHRAGAPKEVFAGKNARKLSEFIKPSVPPHIVDARGASKKSGCSRPK